MSLLRPSALALASVICLALAPNVSRSQQGDGTDVSIQATIYKPAKVPPTPERLAQVKAPPGFKVTTFASGLKNARVIAVAPDGTVYVSRRDQGDVLMLRDTDGDGRADGPPVTVVNRAGAHGLAIRDGRLYLVTVKELFMMDILADGRLSEPLLLAGDLPDAGQHANRTIAFGPDGMLYLSVGSTCNTCNESNPENATMLRMSPDGKNRTIMAGGLRNTIGFDWEPKTGELWGMDHGIDYLGDTVQPEELNHIQTGRQYGWPHVYGTGDIYPQSTPVGDITKAQWKAMSTPMVLGYDAHAAPMQMLFYRGSAFPAEYRGDAFVTMRGSWNRKPASGYEIVRIRFENGQAKAIQPFVTGFLTDGGTTHIARPVGLAMAKDGALLMADDGNGAIYRIAYDGASGGSQAMTSAPAGPMRQQAMKGTGVALAVDREETRTAGALGVASTFQADALIDKRHSEYADGASPALAWSPVAGAKSYAIIVEDPDARPASPFVHWVAWNIPGTLDRLPEGVQEQPRLTDPDGMLQGRTTRGSTGWYGMHPPVGDAPHHYHFQVLALDTVLDLMPGATRDEMLAAAKGHVIAKGTLVGRYAQTVAPLK